MSKVEVPSFRFGANDLALTVAAASPPELHEKGNGEFDGETGADQGRGTGLTSWGWG